MGCGSAKVLQNGTESSTVHHTSSDKSSKSRRNKAGLSRYSSPSTTSTKANRTTGIVGSLGYIRSQLENKEKTRDKASTKENPYHEVRLQHNKIRPSVSAYECSSARQYPDENFRVRTSVSATSRIRVTLSSDGSMIEIETEKLRAAQHEYNIRCRSAGGENGAIDDEDDEDSDGYVCLSEEPGVSGVNDQHVTRAIVEHHDRRHDESSLSSSDGDAPRPDTSHYPDTLPTHQHQCPGKGKQHRNRAKKSVIKSHGRRSGDVLNHDPLIETEAANKHCEYNTCERCKGRVVMTTTPGQRSRCLDNTEAVERPMDTRSEDVSQTADRANTILLPTPYTSSHQISHKEEYCNGVVGSVLLCQCQTDISDSESYCVIGAGAAREDINRGTCFHPCGEASAGQAHTFNHRGPSRSSREPTPLTTPVSPPLTDNFDYANTSQQIGRLPWGSEIHGDATQPPPCLPGPDQAITNGGVSGGNRATTSEKSYPHDQPSCDSMEIRTDIHPMNAIKTQLGGTSSRPLLKDVEQLSSFSSALSEQHNQRGNRGRHNKTEASDLIEQRETDISDDAHCSLITESIKKDRGSKTSIVTRHSTQQSTTDLADGNNSHFPNDGRPKGSVCLRSNKTIDIQTQTNGYPGVHHEDNLTSPPNTTLTQTDKSSMNINGSAKKKRTKFWLRKVNSESDKEHQNSNYSNSSGKGATRQGNKHKLKLAGNKCLSFDSATVLENRVGREKRDSPPSRGAHKPTKHAFVNCANGTGPKTDITPCYAVHRSFSYENSNSSEAGSSTCSNKNCSTTPVYKYAMRRSDSSDHSLTSAYSSDFSNSSRRSSRKNRVIGENTTHQIVEFGLMISNPIEHEVDYTISSDLDTPTDTLDAVGEEMESDDNRSEVKGQTDRGRQERSVTPTEELLVSEQLEGLMGTASGTADVSVHQDFFNGFDDLCDDEDVT